MPTTDDAGRRLLEAILPVASGLKLAVVLRRIVEAACDLVDARYGALGVLGPDRALSDFITVGMDEDQIRAVGHLPEGEGILGLLILEPHPIRLTDLTKHPDSYGFPANHPPMQSFLGVPLRVRDVVFGNLYMCGKRGAAEFTAEDQELLVGLAAAAGVAIENARLASRVRQLALLEDRERIARDLHDTVIQRLFAVGMQLQGTAKLIDEPEVAARLSRAVDDLDETVRDIRSTIFSLHASAGGDSLRDALTAIADEASGALGFRPTLYFDGAVDSLVSDELGAELRAVLREALANVAKHADSGHAVVRVVVQGGSVALSVDDDGVGIDGGPAGRVGGNGLANMRDRAERRGGRFDLAPRPDGGCRLVWSAELSP
ncbi:MAG: GAF domain-containing protein [Actinomycetota bacterium]